MTSLHRARFAVAYVFFMLGSMVGAWASRIPDIKIILGVDESGFGLILLCMALGAFSSFPFSGPLIDRWGAARVARFSAVFILLVFVALTFGTSVPFMVPIAYLNGLAMGALDVSMNGWGAEVEQELGKPVMSSYHGLYSLGAGAGAGAGAIALWLELTVPSHFYLWALISSGPLIWALLTPWTSKIQEPSSGPKAPMFAVPKGALLFVGLMALIAALGEGAITDWAALYQIQELGFDSSTAAIGFSVFSVAMVVMRLAGDKIIARFGPVRVAQVSGIAAALGTGLLVLGGSVWVVWAGCVVMGLGNAVIFPLAMSRAAADPTISKGRALASVATLGYGAFLFGPPILGFIGDALSLRMSFALVAILAVFISLMAGNLKVEKRQPA